MGAAYLEKQFKYLNCSHTGSIFLIDIKEERSYKKGAFFVFIPLLEFLGSHLLWFALHIEGSSFPKPLSAAKEKECFLKMEQGDTHARDLLIEHNLRLVAHIAKKYYSITNDQDDLISIGTIGLIKAVGTFQYEKGTRFATYGARCIENVILTQRLYSISNRETVTPRLCAGRSGNRKKTTCLSSTARSLALSPMRRSTFCGSLSIR